ncbi:MAG: hypothetical protein FWG75_02650 [Cystobacterineae bacterium]|nr:hypothetical protein [Cystobacterineae bacterium]
MKTTIKKHNAHAMACLHVLAISHAIVHKPGLRCVIAKSSRRHGLGGGPCISSIPVFEGKRKAWAGSEAV